jgi:hypothetical protein
MVRRELTLFPEDTPVHTFTESTETVETEKIGDPRRPGYSDGTLLRKASSGISAQQNHTTSI